MKQLMGSISEGLAATLMKTGRTHLFSENQEIFAEGDDALFLPIVLSGSVKMIHFLEPGKEVIIGIFHSGEMFAIPPVFDGKKYPSTAISMQESQLLLLARSEFLALLRESHEFVFAVINWMSEMLREKTATIQNLATASPEHRIGHVLLKLAEKATSDSAVRIALRREDIAKIAGLSTETTIRVIRKFAEKDLLTIVNGKIVISDTGPLRKYAEH